MPPSRLQGHPDHAHKHRDLCDRDGDGHTTCGSVPGGVDATLVDCDDADAQVGPCEETTGEETDTQPLVEPSEEPTEDLDGA